MDSKGFIRIGWFLTDACNLRCRHCYHQDFAQSIDISKKQMTIDKIIINEIISLSKSWDIETVGILGGEPLLHPHIFDYIKELKDYTNCFITIATNGLLIDDEMLEKIKKCTDLQLQISLDSPISMEHDFYRGTGTYDKTIKIIQKLVDNKLKPIIRMTVSKINLHSMEDFVRLGRDLNVASVSINKYIADAKYPSGYLKPLVPIQHDKFIERLVYLKEKYGNDFVLTEDPCLNNYYKDSILGEFNEELKEGLPVGGCSAGLCNITIGKNGSVYPCTLLQLEIGNLADKHLVDIWEDENEVLDNLRDRANSLKGKCAGCESLLICGGCRAAAHKMKGDYLQEDPYCNAVPEWEN